MEGGVEAELIADVDTKEFQRLDHGVEDPFHDLVGRCLYGSCRRRGHELPPPPSCFTNGSCVALANISELCWVDKSSCGHFFSGWFVRGPRLIAAFARGPVIGEARSAAP